MGDFRKILEDIENLKRKYESQISVLVLEKLAEFRQEFGELPNEISVYSTRVNQFDKKAPYFLDITTKIDIGL